MQLPARQFGRLLATWLLVSGALPALAQQGQFEIRQVATAVDDGVLYVNADIDYRLSDIALDALQNGIALTFELRFLVERPRRWRPNKDVAELRQRYELRYRALSDRYIVRNINSGDLMSFGTLEEARRGLGTIRRLPLIDVALINLKKRHTVRVRAVLDTRELAGPLRWIPVLWDDWRLASDWYRWELEL